MNNPHGPDAGLMLAHRLRRWASIKTALGQRVHGVICDNSGSVDLLTETDQP